MHPAKVKEERKGNGDGSESTWADLFKFFRIRSADCALTFVPPTVNEGVKIARLKPECEGGGKVEIGFNWLCVRIDTEVG